jgi:hypothetical protein
MSCVGVFTCRYTFGDKKRVTEPHQAGAAEPAGATSPAGAAGPAGVAGPTGAAGPAGAVGPAGAIGPTPCPYASPGDYYFHEHTLNGYDSSWLCRFDPKGVKGSTWIHGPTSASIQPPL